MAEHGPWRDRFRNYILDMHNPSPELVPDLTLHRIDVAAYIRTYQAAGVDSIHVYCKGHWGYSWYRTAVGTMHPALGGRDFLGEHLEHGHAAGLEVIAYYSVGYDNLAVLTHPDWVARDPEGAVVQLVVEGRPRWYLPCPNSPYRDYCLAQVEEIARGYRVDGIFLDIPRPHPCYCPRCRERYRRDLGTELRPAAQMDEAAYRAFVAWTCQLWRDLFADLRTAAQRQRPGLPVVRNANAMSEPPFRVIPMPADFITADDYGFGETIAGSSPTGAWLRGAHDRDYQLTIGNLSEVYDPGDPTVCALEVASILAQGGRPSVYSEAQRVDGTLHQHHFTLLAAAYRGVAERAAYVRDASSVKEIGVLFTDPMLATCRPQGTPARFLGLLGALDLLAELHLPYDVVHGWTMAAETLAQYRLLILPDLPVLSEAQGEMVRAWVRAGGALLAAGAVGTHDERGAPRPDWLLGDVLGARHLGLAREYAANRVGSYFVAEPHPITAALPPTELALPGPHRRVAATTAQVLGWHVLPVAAETRERWVNWHSAPPARRSDDPALLLNRYGAGSVVYCAPPLFTNLRGDVLGQTYPDAVRSYHGGIILRWPRALLAGAIAHLLPAPRVRLDASPRVEATFFTRERSRQLVVHLLNRAVRDLGGGVRLDERVRLRLHRGFGSPRRLAQVWPREVEGWPSEFRPEGEELVAEGPAPALHTILVADL